jgi:hypothetical protein
MLSRKHSIQEGTLEPTEPQDHEQPEGGKHQEDRRKEQDGYCDQRGWSVRLP